MMPLAARALATERQTPSLAVRPAADARSTTALMHLLASFDPISLAEMDAVALQNRTDTKYLLTTNQLLDALSILQNDYRVLTIEQIRLAPYQTLYFDTADFAMYRAHHAGKLNRYKVRSRRYDLTGAAFLEIKRKTNKDRTIKYRIPTENLATACTPEIAALVATYAPTLANTLTPQLWSGFSRMTLVNHAETERLTIDVDLRFWNETRTVQLPGVAVAEVKQSGHSRASGFIEQMHAAHLQPTGFSKYCIGVAMLFPTIKQNNFKPKLRLIEQLIGESDHD